jgi:cytochrome P450
MSPYIMHRHPVFWDTPHEFSPDRFSDESVNNRPRYAYFPFGGGPRVCIGEPFAWAEGELLLATIMQHFNLTLVPNAAIEPLPLITLRLKYGLPMQIKSIYNQ